MKTIKLLIFIAAISIAIGKKARAEEPVWSLLSKSENVSIYYHPDVCMGKQVLTLQLVNNTDQQLTVSWSLWGDGVFKKIQLNGKEKKTGACNSSPAAMLNEFIPAGKAIKDLAPAVKVN